MQRAREAPSRLYDGLIDWLLDEHRSSAASASSSASDPSLPPETRARDRLAERLEARLLPLRQPIELSMRLLFGNGSGVNRHQNPFQLDEPRFYLSILVLAAFSVYLYYFHITLSLICVVMCFCTFSLCIFRMPRALKYSVPILVSCGVFVLEWAFDSLANLLTFVGIIGLIDLLFCFRFTLRCLMLIAQKCSVLIDATGKCSPIDTQKHSKYVTFCAFLAHLFFLLQNALIACDRFRRVHRVALDISVTLIALPAGVLLASSNLDAHEYLSLRLPVRDLLPLLSLVLMLVPDVYVVCAPLLRSWASIIFDGSGNSSSVSTAGRRASRPHFSLRRTRELAHRPAGTDPPVPYDSRSLASASFSAEPVSNGNVDSPDWGPEEQEEPVMQQREPEMSLPEVSRFVVPNDLLMSLE